MDTITAIAICGALVLIACLALLGLLAVRTTKQNDATTPKDEALNRPQVALRAAPAEAGVVRRGAADRARAARLRRRVAAQQAANEGHDERDGEEEESGSEGDEQQVPGDRREQRRAARAAGREAEIAGRSARDRKREAYDEKQRLKESERERREQAQAEEIAAAERERIERENEEANKWLSMISVEEEGTAEAETSQDESGVLGQFVEYIKAAKSVPLETIALEFGLRTSDVIDRIRGLEEIGRLTGVMDERGKYIYISVEEMEAVAAFIRSKGRVAISQLAASSSTFIDLDVNLKAGLRPVAGMDLDLDLAVEAS